MPNWLKIWPLLVALLIGGCAAVQPLPSAPVSGAAVESATARAQQAINEANAALTSLNTAILSAYRTGTISREDAQNYATASIDIGNQVDLAQQAIRYGNKDAGSQAEAARSLAVSLYARLRPLLVKEAK